MEPGSTAAVRVAGRWSTSHRCIQELTWTTMKDTMKYRLVVGVLWQRGFGAAKKPGLYYFGITSRKPHHSFKNVSLTYYTLSVFIRSSVHSTRCISTVVCTCSSRMPEHGQESVLHFPLTLNLRVHEKDR